MAGILRRLFGGSQPIAPDPDPLPGVGGVNFDHPPGPYGATGFPGSTSVTRTFAGASPRQIGLRSTRVTGWDSGLSALAQVRQASSRGDTAKGSANPRFTPRVVTQQPQIAAGMQNNHPTEFYGGLPLHTRKGSDNIGGNPLGWDGQPGDSVRDTETPMVARQPQLSAAPLKAPPRNQTALKWMNPPGSPHTYRSAPRADQAVTDVTADDGAGMGANTTMVTVPNRFVFKGGGVQTWFMEREMPYGARGDGARGASLNGQRYYAAGPPTFSNAGQGQYGQIRAAGPRHRPTQFQEPAPWSTNYYDTTEGAGSWGTPGASGQVPDMVYTSPEPGRAGNGTGRTG